MKKIIFTVIVLATIIAASLLGAAAYSTYQKPSTTTSTATIIGYGITAALFIVQERNLSVPYSLSPFDPIFPVESNYIAANVGQADFIFAAQPLSVNVTSCQVSLRKATEISTSGYNITGLYQSSGCIQPPTNTSSIALSNAFEFQYVVFNVTLPNSTSPQSFTALQMNVTYALSNSPITYTYDLYHSSQSFGTMLTSGTDFDYVLGNNASAMYASVANINQYFGVGNLRLYLSFSPMVVLASRKSLGNGMKYLILVMWIAFPVIGSFFLNAVTNPYEFNMIFPVNFLIIGILFDYALKRISSSATSSDPKIKRASNLGKLVAITLLVSIIAAQVTFDAGFFNCLNVHEGTNGDYGVGWQYKAEAASYIAKNTVGNNFTISYPNDIGIEYYYLLSLYNQTPSTSSTANFIIDTLDPPPSSSLQPLESYSNVTLGPLIVYTISK